MIGDILCGADMDLMWENKGTWQELSGQKAGEQTTNIILRTQEAGLRVTLVGAGPDACGGPGASSRILLERILVQHLLGTAQRFKATSRFPLSQRKSGSSLNVDVALAGAFPTDCDLHEPPTEVI